MPGATWHGQARPSRLEQSPRPKKDSANDIAAGALTAYDKHESMPPGFTTLVPFGGPCLRAGGGLGSRVVTHQTPDSRPQGWLGAGILNLESRIRGLNVNTVRTHGSRSKQKHDALRAKRRAGSLNVVSSEKASQRTAKGKREATGALPTKTHRLKQSLTGNPSPRPEILSRKAGVTPQRPHSLVPEHLRGWRSAGTRVGSAAGLRATVESSRIREN